MPFLLLVFTTCAAASEPLQLATPEPNNLEIRRGKEGPVLVTCLSTETHGRPYLHPLRSPDGKGVLTEFSPGHHKHQTGLYWGPTRINGRDYFHNYNRKFWANTRIKPLDGKDGMPVSWTTTSELLGAGAKPVLRETQKWSIIDHDTWYTLDLEWSAEARTDVVISMYPYGGLFLRMPWKRGVPTECVNSEGQKNQAGEGKPARWVDLAMKIDGMEEMAHIAIIDHPKNAGHPTLWRIDGQFGIGPAFTRKGDVDIPNGDQTTYRYRLVVYQGEFDKDLVEEQNKMFGAK